MGGKNVQKARPGRCAWLCDRVHWGSWVSWVQVVASGRTVPFDLRYFLLLPFFWKETAFWHEPPWNTSKWGRRKACFSLPCRWPEMAHNGLWVGQLFASLSPLLFLFLLLHLLQWLSNHLALTKGKPHTLWKRIFFKGFQGSSMAEYAPSSMCKVPFSAPHEAQ